jgi:hypothetical protein
MYRIFFSLLLILFPLSGSLSSAQTGPSIPGQDSLVIFAGSGENEVLIHNVSPSAEHINVVSGEINLLDVLEIQYFQGQTFARVLIMEKGITGKVILEIELDDSVRELAIYIVNYNITGVNYQVHDIVFWQLAVPLTQEPVFDTVLQVAINPHNDLNWGKIPLTVNLDCTAAVCWGYDFYTGFYRGYLIPPVTGTYQFYMQSENERAMWLSTDNNFSNAIPIIHSDEDIGDNVGGSRWRSAPIDMEAGKVYAFYATQWIIHNPYGGILWDGPGIDQPEYITGEHMAPVYDTEKPTVPGDPELIWRASDQAYVSWSQSTDNDRVDSYNIYVDGVKYNKEPLRETSIRIENLAESTIFNVVATAIDPSGNESFVSNVLAFETHPLDTISPFPPAELAVIETTGLAIHVRWTGATDGETEVIAYNLYLDGELYNSTDYIFDDNLVIRELIPETEYSITIESIDAGFNISDKSPEFEVSTVVFDPLGPGLGEKVGRVLVYNQNISWNDGIGLNGPYGDGSMVDDPAISGMVREFKAGAIRWGAIDANSKSFSASTGTGKPNTYARMLNFANEIDAWFALTVGVQEGIDYMTDSDTFLNLLEYLAGDESTTWGAVRAAEGFSAPLLQEGKGVLLEFGNEVWGAAVHNSEIGANYDNYAAWVREMSDVVRSSPYYDKDKIIMVYSGRNPHPDYSWGINNKVLNGDKGHVECLGVSGYLGGNLNYDPEVPSGESELDYYKNGISMARRNLEGFVLTMKDMLRLSGGIKTFYLYESNMTTTSYNGRLGQAVTMTDYLASSMRYGSIVPSVFHLTGGQWRITRPQENFRQLPLFVTGKYFNRFCKGHVIMTDFVTNNTIEDASGQTIDWEPVGAHAYSKGGSFTLLLVNRDFADSYTVQLELPEEFIFNSDATMFTLWGDDFSSFDINVDSVNIQIENGMLVNIPKHSMILISAGMEDPGFNTLPLGYFDRVRPDSLNAYIEGSGVIETNRGAESIWAYAYPSNSFSNDVFFEILDNETESTLTFLTNRTHVRGSGVCGDEGYITVRAAAVDNHQLSDTFRIFVTNQGQDCHPVSAELISDIDNIVIYPNPAVDFVYIDGNIDKEAKVEVIDFSGRLVIRKQLCENNNLYVGHLKPGIYIMNISVSGSEVIRAKFKKE